MTDAVTVGRLAALADLVLQDRLGKLRAAAAARARTAGQIAALAERPVAGMDPLVAAQASLRYQQWADARRQEMNLVLARQTAAWMTAHARAAEAFGRAEVIATLASRARRKP